MNMGIDYPTPTLNPQMNFSRGSNLRGFMNTGFLVLGLVCVICITMFTPGSGTQPGHGKLIPNPYNDNSEDTKVDIFSSKGVDDPLFDSKGKPEDESKERFRDPKSPKDPKDDPDLSPKMPAPEDIPVPKDAVPPIDYSNNPENTESRPIHNFIITKELNDIRIQDRIALNTEFCNQIKDNLGVDEGKKFLFKLQCLSNEECWDIWDMDYYFLCEFN